VGLPPIAGLVHGRAMGTPAGPLRITARSTAESLSGLAATWGWRRSECGKSKASAVLGGDGSSGFAAVCRDLKPIRSEYPVGYEDAGWDRVAVACGAAAIDIAGMDHDEPSGPSRTERVS
jgi:hypothetical protein